MTKIYKFSRSVSLLKKVLVLGLVISSCSKHGDKEDSRHSAGVLTQPRIVETMLEEVERIMTAIAAEAAILLKMNNPEEAYKKIDERLGPTGMILEKTFQILALVGNTGKERDIEVVRKLTWALYAHSIMSEASKIGNVAEAIRIIEALKKDVLQKIVKSPRN